MYKCVECGMVFEEPKMYSEDCTPYGGSGEYGFINKYYGCPNCEGNYEKAVKCSICEEYYIENELNYIDDGYVCENCKGDDENV